MKGIMDLNSEDKDAFWSDGPGLTRKINRIEMIFIK
jgi:hypothetical protein